MARRINQDNCIQCGACLEVCPNGGITEMDAVYMIDPNLCQDCQGFAGQTHCEEACPVGAIEEDTMDWGDARRAAA